MGRNALALAALLAFGIGCDGDLTGENNANNQSNNQNNSNNSTIVMCEPETSGPVEPLTDFMPPTRQLRRAALLLTGQTPDVEAYQSLLDAPDEAAAQISLEASIDSMMTTDAFYRRLVDFGHDWINVGQYTTGASGEAYWGHFSGVLSPCPADSLHPGALYLQPEGGYGSGDKSGTAASPNGICFDSAPDGSGAPYDANEVDIEPWWAPGTTVKVVGRAGTGVRKHPAKAGGGDYTCGIFGGIYFTPALKDDAQALEDPVCSCGPNLVYCQTFSGFGGNNSYDLKSQRRNAWEEPARFFAHLVWHDRPLHHLLTANYSVGTSALRHLYVRWARQNPANVGLDDSTWWKNDADVPMDPEHEGTDPLAWREFVVETLNPSLLSGGTTPNGDLTRTASWDASDPSKGLATAGVMTMMGSNSSFSRERVRAARYTEMFACREFSPPPAEIHFQPYETDPATTGTCQYCHQIIDPAAIAFKRWGFQGDYIWDLPVLGGINTAVIPADAQARRASPFRRWFDAWTPESVMTPVTQAQIDANPHVLLNDTISSEKSLFGVKNDGTSGPLGFGKMLVESGEFDRCAVRQLHKFAVGRDVDPAVENGYLKKLVQEFVAGDRQAKPFIKSLMLSETFKRGL